MTHPLLFALFLAGHGWIALAIAAATALLVGITVANPGRGCNLAYNSSGFSSFSNVGQLKSFKGAGGKASFDKVGNLDSPDINEEYLKTIIDAGEISLDGVYNGADPYGVSNLLAQMYVAGQASLGYWQITFSDTSTLQFRAYVSDLQINVDYSKAVVYSAKLMVTGGFTASWV